MFEVSEHAEGFLKPLFLTVAPPNCSNETKDIQTQLRISPSPKCASSENHRCLQCYAFGICLHAQSLFLGSRSLHIKNHSAPSFQIILIILRCRQAKWSDEEILQFKCWKYVELNFRKQITTNVRQKALPNCREKHQLNLRGPQKSTSQSIWFHKTANYRQIILPISGP